MERVHVRVGLFLCVCVHTCPCLCACVCVCACVCALNCRASGGRGVSECQRGQQMMWGSRVVWRRGCGGGVCVCVCVCVCVGGVERGEHACTDRPGKQQ